MKAEIVDDRPVNADVSVSRSLDGRSPLFRSVLGKDRYNNDDLVTNMLVVMVEAGLPNRIILDDADDVRVNVPNIHNGHVEHPARCQDVFADLAGAINDDTPLAEDSKVELKVIVGPSEAKKAFVGGICQLHLKLR